jgi:hypothetical protein
MTDFNSLVVKFNNNLKKIKRELTMSQVAELYKEHSPEDDGHLAKILAIKGVSL